MINAKSHPFRRLFFAAIAALLALAWLYHTISRGSESAGRARWIQDRPYAVLEAATLTVTVHAPETTVVAPVLMKETATGSFEDNLRPELKYITAWPTFGWNNQVMQYMNLIYLGLITERIPIVPPFTPDTNPHVASKEYIDFGQVFDIPRLEKEMGQRVLDWSQVKDPKSDELDDLGCWNLEVAVWKATWRSHRPDNLKLDISYTIAPEWVKLRPGDYTDMQATFWSLASLGYADTRPANSDLEPERSPIHNISLWPNEHLLCFDNVYFVCAHQAWEFDKQYSPAWRFVGRQMHWTSAIQSIADNYTRNALGVEYDEAIPPYITVHARRGDFGGDPECKNLPAEDCLAPLSAYARRVEEVKAEILETKSISIDRIIMTSDEKDPAWWNAVYQLGWTTPDHSQTAERYGAWYPIFIDGVIQSGGLGFVGTHKSTVSILADRRVSAWQGGVTRTVYWGWKGADDH
ncbi:hypothetical protein B0H11DRAFT_2277367 [Mycena galericulata]|nr:hypothetical protein B0H11DRAFT_2277367 [Mycena galericulata]